MPWNFWSLSYARKKPAKAGFTAGNGISVNQVSFRGLVEFLKKKLQDGFSLIFVFLGDETLSFAEMGGNT